MRISYFIIFIATVAVIIYITLSKTWNSTLPWVGHAYTFCSPHCSLSYTMFPRRNSRQFWCDDQDDESDSCCHVPGWLRRRGGAAIVSVINAMCYTFVSAGPGQISGVYSAACCIDINMITFTLICFTLYNYLNSKYMLIMICKYIYFITWIIIKIYYL